MSRKVELEIREILKDKSGDLEFVADELIKRWSKATYSDSDIETAAQFLLNAGLYPSLLDRISAQLQKKEPLPWRHFLELLIRSENSLGDKEAQYFIEGCEKQSKTSSLATVFDAEKVHIEIGKVQGEEFKKKEDQFIKERNDLFEKVLFLKSQRLFDEEKRALDALGLIAPNDEKFLEMKFDFEERWARFLVSQKNHGDLSTRTSQQIQKEWQKETLPTFKNIYKSCIYFAKKYPERALDLALLAYFMDFTAHAIEILELAPSSVETDWLHLELLLENRRFVRALEVAGELEARYANDPDAAFAATLAKAKAYHGLGQTERGIELLKNIINIRPNYRSVSTLLQHWQGHLS